MIQQSLKKTEGTGFIKVKGNCMVPLLKEDELVPFMPVSPSELKKGDIAVLKQDDTLFIHRILDKFEFCKQVFLIHKGDASPLPLVTPLDALIGKVSLKHAAANFRKGPILKLRIFWIRLKLKVKIWLQNV
ncbi:MAG: hypothetical protein AMJ95_11995 [Omnitrophica WOR_2 bacterium SM23_72]|nr:MAG: hypothetical protein AMJ95_11995 [Omnitrophica WOR_2 bacterium SM23_72]